MDYVDQTHFYIHHEFKYANGPVDYEYFAYGDGVIYGVNNTIKRVRLIKAEKPILRELTRGMPQVQISEIIRNATKVMRVQQNGGYTLFGSTGAAGRGFVVDLDADRLDVLNVKLGILKATGKPEIARTSEEIRVTKPSQDVSCPLPAEVVYRSFKGTGQLVMEETWRLVSWSRKAALSDLHTQKYVLQPNFHVDDETGLTLRKFLSNEVLNRGR